MNTSVLEEEVPPCDRAVINMEDRGDSNKEPTNWESVKLCASLGEEVRISPGSLLLGLCSSEELESKVDGRFSGTQTELIILSSDDLCFAAAAAVVRTRGSELRCTERSERLTVTGHRSRCRRLSPPREPLTGEQPGHDRPENEHHREEEEERRSPPAARPAIGEGKRGRGGGRAAVPARLGSLQLRVRTPDGDSPPAGERAELPVEVFPVSPRETRGSSEDRYLMRGPLSDQRTVIPINFTSLSDQWQQSTCRLFPAVTGTGQVPAGGPGPGVLGKQSQHRPGAGGSSEPEECK
ncbi:unnamed protein product [Pleuronectes platessa]|uniref:Uncharacterized protein n=1 Tax=Pleuronectes platessa TaxID=8262 RepID=A0A9N7TJF4_PLEPL|nr:unnamed protein product [Pleuronectes platessa]